MLGGRIVNIFLKFSITAVIVFAAACLKSWSQCADAHALYTAVIRIDKNDSLNDKEKLTSLYTLKAKAEKCKVIFDSGYAAILIKIAKYDGYNKTDYNLAIRYTANAIKINNAAKKNGSVSLVMKSYYNIATYYQLLTFSQQSLAYYDTVIMYCGKYIDTSYYELDSRYHKSDIYFAIGDLEKAIEECTLGLKKATANLDSSYLLSFLNMRAQSLVYQNNLQQSYADASLAIKMAIERQDFYELAWAYKTTGMVYEKQKNFSQALIYFKQAIAARKKTLDPSVIASDYNYLGAFYLTALSDFDNSVKCYLQTMKYAKNMTDTIAQSLKIAMANTNIGEANFRRNNLDEAKRFYAQALQDLHLNAIDYIETNITARQANAIGNKDLVFTLFSNKIELLLTLYNQTHQTKYLDYCLQTALVADSVITQARHEQLGEQSKLYWRNETRDIFTNAMEACYLKQDAKLAFYFMEKSRAVLLADKLNELGAAAHLPPAEATKEEDLQIKIIQLQQLIAGLNASSKAYENGMYTLLKAKEERDNYIKSLEKNYPAYYQYKYADEVPVLADMQKYLAQNNQSFVHYFMNDTVTYVLGITPTKTVFFKPSANEYSTQQLVSYSQQCANKQALNKNYKDFAALSNSLYKNLFAPLQLPKGSVAICPDNYLIPFESLCTDVGGKHFLLYDYRFSYVYAASALLKPSATKKASGNFLGFAPVSFAKNLQLPDLKQSAQALNSNASYYNNNTLFTQTAATRSSFFKHAANYSVITIFSHAMADASEREPMLFMCDSVIHLSELQLLKNPAAQLVLLSACQTNIGKTATGEGVYSLARGFAAVGIPSVAATLWNADEQTIYSVSQKFNEYLAQGVKKDEALQKAKIFFIENNNSAHTMPYYWANMILVGNAKPIILSTSHNWWCLIAVGVAILLSAFCIFWLTKKVRKTL